MSVKIINHNNPEEIHYLFEVVNIDHDIKGRTVTVTDIFGDKEVIDLKIYDVMMTVV